MKLRYTSSVIVLTMFTLITGCATSKDVISEKSEIKRIESNNQDELNTLRNYENVQSKMNSINELKIVLFPEKPGQ